MESPSDSWAREMSRAGTESLVVSPEDSALLDRLLDKPCDVRLVERPGTSSGDIYALRSVGPLASPAWDCALIAELNPHLGALRLRLDPRIDAVLVMDESTDMGLVITRATVEELGGLRAALAVGINRLLEARAWPAAHRVALGGR